MSGFKFTEVNGDLFKAPEEYALAINVKIDADSQVKMLDLIALRVRNKFSQVYCLEKETAQIGSTIHLVYEGRFIFYLINEDHRGATFETLKSCVSELRAKMLANNVRKVTMPYIGCHWAGRLKWPEVRDMIIKTFENDSIEVLCYNYNPGYTSA